ncbi:hypothetical protein DL546_005208 [Coniochaeta pulveracea]|uniref:Uncharacterized protein n=1 Tax=Coniochaeta pulveracea TaxID=177199 RepID=A0A420Y7V0_9PEZI|nr:hypothetical protein DL546_005208 [Coniochaeta pulveracea]
MCLIIQTLHSCQHKQYSNTYPCVAAGRPPNQAALTTTKFLPELRPAEEEEEEARQPACQKRHPVRPVRTLCTQCQREVVKAKAFGTGAVAGEQPANKNREYCLLPFSYWEACLRASLRAALRASF